MTVSLLQPFTTTRLRVLSVYRVEASLAYPLPPTYTKDTNKQTTNKQTNNRNNLKKKTKEGKENVRIVELL